MAEKLDSYWTLISQWQGAASCSSSSFFSLSLCQIPAGYPRWPPAGWSLLHPISQMNTFLLQTMAASEFDLFSAGAWHHEIKSPPPPLRQFGARSGPSHAPSSTSAVALNVLRFCAVECRRWLRVAVCTPPKTPPSCCRRVHLCFEGSSQVHMNFKVCVHWVVHGARLQRKFWRQNCIIYCLSKSEEGKLHITSQDFQTGGCTGVTGNHLALTHIIPEESAQCKNRKKTVWGKR